MKDDDSLPVSTPTTSSSTSVISRKDRDSAADSAGLLGRGRYKFWALAAILLLAFWSMLTGTVSLRWSAGNLNRYNDDYYNSAASVDDLDVLDMEEREKLVRDMWDVYTNRVRLTGFWQDAFVAAYEELMSDVPEIRAEAIAEIARMSPRYVKLPQHWSSFSLSLQELNLNQVDHRASTSSRKKL